MGKLLMVDDHLEVRNEDGSTSIYEIDEEAFKEELKSEILKNKNGAGMIIITVLRRMSGHTFSTRQNFRNTEFFKSYEQFCFSLPEYAEKCRRSQNKNASLRKLSEENRLNGSVQRILTDGAVERKGKSMKTEKYYNI